MKFNKTYKAAKLDNTLIDKWTDIGLMDNGSKTLATGYEIAIIYLSYVSKNKALLLNLNLFPMISRIFKNRSDDTLDFDGLLGEIKVISNMYVESIHKLSEMVCYNMIDCEAEYMDLISKNYLKKINE
jgi:hypothetical protein